jgi:hypothetical protein
VQTLKINSYLYSTAHNHYYIPFHYNMLLSWQFNYFDI